MMWILMKIIADVLSAGNTLTVKEMLSSRVRDQRLYLFCVAMVSLPFAAIGIYQLFMLPSLFHVLVALIVGITYITGGHFYYRAMSVEQPSRLSLIFRTGSVFTLFFALIILREQLTVLQYIGCGLSFVGGLILLLERASRHVRFSCDVRYALLCNLSIALSSTLKAYLLRGYSSWDTFVMTRVGLLGESVFHFLSPHSSV